ncbi:unnamed protein product [Phaeothamnion confervicola]
MLSDGRRMLGLRWKSGGSGGGDNGGGNGGGSDSGGGAGLSPNGGMSKSPPAERPSWGSRRGVPMADSNPRRTPGTVTPPPTTGGGAAPNGLQFLSNRTKDSLPSFPPAEIAVAVRLQRGSPDGDVAGAGGGGALNESSGSEMPGISPVPKESASTPAAEAKSDIQAVFERLCASQVPATLRAASGSGGGARTPVAAASRAGGPMAASAVAEAAAPDGGLLALETLLRWEEVEELRAGGILTAADAEAIWAEARAAAAEANSAGGSNASGRGGGTGGAGSSGGGVGGGGGSGEGMTLVGFAAFIRLLEERHFQKELEQAFGIALVEGPVYEV